MSISWNLEKNLTTAIPDLESWIRQAYENCRLVESELPDFETFKKTLIMFINIINQKWHLKITLKRDAFQHAFRQDRDLLQDSLRSEPA